MTKNRAGRIEPVLTADLQEIARIESRRRALRAIAGLGIGVGLIPIFGCGASTSSSSGGSSGSSGTSGTSGTSGECGEIPDETNGPYPADGTNGPNTLTASGIVRADLRSSFGSMSGTAAGIPLKVDLTIVDAKAACAALPGYAVYAWHCDKDGKYSIYELTSQNYLRGVQETDANGKVSFTTAFPGAYNGRYPHIHFEIFSSLANATAATGKVKTSQLALSEAACTAVYETSGYEVSKTNFPRTPLARDNVFSDGSNLQVSAVSGDVAGGYTATLIVGV